MKEAPRFAGSWKVLFIGLDQQLRRDLMPYLAQCFETVSVSELAGYATDNSLIEPVRKQAAQLFILDVSSNPEAALALVPYLTRSHPDAPIVAVLKQKDPDLILGCLRQGTADFLLHPFTEEDINTVLAKVAGPLARATAHGGAKVYAVMPVKGGCGASTISCNLAFHCQRSSKKRVLLADLDPLAGTLSFLLKVKSSYSFLDVTRRGEVDADLWRGVVTRRGGVDILLSPDIMVEGLNQLPTPAIIIDFARTQYDTILLDAGSVYGAWNTGMAQLADEVILVSTNELTAVHSLQRALYYLESNNVGRAKTKIVLNRYNKDVGLATDVISMALNREVFHVAPSDYEALQRSLLEGKPVPRNSQIGKSIARLGVALQPPPPPAEKQRKPSLTGALLSLLSRT